MVCTHLPLRFQYHTLDEPLALTGVFLQLANREGWTNFIEAWDYKPQ